ncbi:Stf0 family sulfotransferase [Caenimonas sp. SL110]|uniref:Stf0 family sulfotransferase n=1 Tax=Caenimonas sp. SL110 TaxID=1450524 RepID=UPI00137912E1|nr:Stf0 family sulfotransferase [Caenimonas sp. SL110]
MATRNPGQNRNVGNVRKIDFLMSPERDFPRRSQPATYRYALCSTPRCGSNMVGDMLFDTGLAGNPQEYLNTRYMAGYNRSMGRDGGPFDLTAYQGDMESRRTSPNGVFGIKIHFEHMESLWKQQFAEMAKYLSIYNQFVLLTRRDKIAQAVSLHKARETQIWASIDYKFLEPDDPRLKIKPAFSAHKIARCLSDLIVQEESWRALLDNFKLPYVVLAYEDLVADFAGESRKLLRVLGLDPDKAKQAPGIRKQGVDNDPMIAQFRELIGAGPLPAAT